LCRYERDSADLPIVQTLQLTVDVRGIALGLVAIARKQAGAQELVRVRS
jgi:hypothetical protein